MSDTESEYLSDESSDSDDSSLLRRDAPERLERFKFSNLFFSNRDSEDSGAVRSTQIYKRNHYEKGLTKDKRTTVQQVLDRRTYVRLRKLCGQGVFHYLHGVISTGKEANVFEAETLPESQLEEFKKKIIAATNPNRIELTHTREIEEKIGSITLSDDDGAGFVESATQSATDADHSEAESRPYSTSHLSHYSPEKGHRGELEPSQSGNDGKGRVAIKVYKTSILVFKDRSRYIAGEFRFRRAYTGTKNPRKMVTQWAEKEFRNLRRIALSGLYSPAPIALKGHVLVMDVVLHNDEVAPKLENLGTLHLVEWQTIYVQTICILRTLFQECKLIHADFSSFNMLYSNGRVYVIDTSQALENDHLNAMPFLKRDCENVTKFFEAVNILHQAPDEDQSSYDTLRILTAEQLFCFIVARRISVRGLSKQEDGTMSNPLNTNMWQEETLSNVKKFWSLDEEQVRAEVADVVEKMTRFNKFGFSGDLTEVITRKRILYLEMCKQLHLVLTGPLFANEEVKKEIPWLREVNFDKQLPLNMSQMPLDIAESILGKSDNIIAAINELSEDDKSDHESEEVNEVADASEKCQGDMNKTNEAPKFTGKIPEGIDPREWKKMVKEHNRERRKHKIPKHIKKKYGSSKS